MDETPTPVAPDSRPRSSSGTSRLRGRFHRHRRTVSSSSIPAELPPATTPTEWEKRATILVGSASSVTPVPPTASDDVAIQEALGLYDANDLTGATEIFAKLAQPPTSNPLAQVFYGLALRHGWGIPADPASAVHYLKLAAKNSGAVEAAALNSGLKNGGKAKGELALAIYELGNSYRNGWGVEKDPVAAREYYETAAMMGEVDAMNEAGWCWNEPFGGKKDRMKSARYYRMAERAGSKTLGNTWYVPTPLTR